MYSTEDILQEFVDQAALGYRIENGKYTQSLTQLDREVIRVERIRAIWRKAANKWRAKQPICRLRDKQNIAQRKWCSNRENRLKKNARMRAYMREYSRRPEIVARNLANRAAKLQYLKQYRERIKDAKRS